MTTIACALMKMWPLAVVLGLVAGGLAVAGAVGVA